ncbi:MAG TPA: FHA domain-containing protein [Sedimentisphaerales bacterium]|nr:FHA domain-containing protein [Sedimentisphaerales bacterium]HRS12954.1 FHA domain-containing protein [Sedimentisphaerales bacterium]HRV49549.1 FHA domain-containing protein [Sedimentisphaerales bacterium]
MNADLVLLKKDGAHKTFSLRNAVTVLGRRHDCDLRIPLPSVSRRHCEIQQNGEVLKIRDLDSTCGTFVNDKRVNGSSPVKAGDYIRIGPLTFVCQIDGKPEKIVAPSKAPPAPPKKAAPAPAKTEPVGGLDDSFADLDASDSAIEFDGLDSDLEDIEKP